MFRKFIYEYDDFGHHYKMVYTHVVHDYKMVYTHMILDYEELPEDESFRIRMEVYKDNKLVRKRWLKYDDGLEAIVDYMCSPDGEKTIVYQDDYTRDDEYKTAKISLKES